MNGQLILKEHNFIKYQCPQCLSWIKYEEPMCYFCTATTNFKHRYPESLIKFLKKNLIPIKVKNTPITIRNHKKDNYYKKAHYLKTLNLPLNIYLKRLIPDLKSTFENSTIKINT